jgi:hypothetical protein
MAQRVKLGYLEGVTALWRSEGDDKALRRTVAD